MGAGVVSTERDVEQCVCAIRPAAVAQSAKRRRDYLGTAGLAASPSAAATAGTLLAWDCRHHSHPAFTLG